MRPRSRQVLVRARIGRGVLAWGLATGLATEASAAPPPAVGAGEPEPARGPGQAAPVLLVRVEGDDAGLAESLVRAVTTELNDVDVAVVVVDAPGLAGDRLAGHDALIRSEGAIGMVTVAQAEGGLVLELVVPGAGMLRRPVIELDEPEAGIEAAAVIVRHFALDLIEGRPIALVPSAAPRPAPSGEGTSPRPPPTSDAGPEPSAEPPPPKPYALGERGRLRIQVGYLGQAWLRERAWDNGGELGIGWRFAVGAHVGLAAGVGQAFAAELVHPDNRGVAQLRVRPYHVALAAGYQRVWARPRLALDAQLRVGVALLERGVFDPAAITPHLDRPLLAVPTVEPRLALEYLAIGPLGLFVAVGARASLARLDYRVDYVDTDGAVVASERPFTPRLVAPVVVAGLDMFF